MKTREEVERLKKDWLRDPCWDIEETEGFEEYSEELDAFARACEKEWGERERSRIEKVAEGYGIPGQIAIAYLIERLQERVAELEGKMGLIRSDVFCRD